MHISILVLLVGAGFLIYGLYQLYQLLKRKKTMRDSQSWPSTSGIVTNSMTKYSRGSKGGKHYWAEIAYKYSVLGLENNAMRKIENLFGGEGVATNSVNAHPIGSTFSVRHNPNKLNEHVPDFEHITSGDIIKVVFFIIFGIFFAIASFFPSGTK